MKPFLKWAGGKYRLVERIKAVLPSGKTLIEPFVGSGAVFLNTDYENYILADANPDLINLFQCVQKEGKSFIDYCRTFFTPDNNDESKFYEFRTLFNITTDVRLKSALFVYLNKHCFNGLCRYNSKGEFNVPFGRYKKPPFPENEMLAFHEKSKRAEFIVADFKETMERAKLGDVVYCDPPYVPLSSTSKFTDYSTGGFGLDRQSELAKLAENLQEKGIVVVISNHETDFTVDAYKNASLDYFDVQRFISSDGKNRNKASELLAVFCVA